MQDLFPSNEHIPQSVKVVGKRNMLEVMIGNLSIYFFGNDCSFRHLLRIKNHEILGNRHSSRFFLAAYECNLMKRDEEWRRFLRAINAYSALACSQTNNNVRSTFR